MSSVIDTHRPFLPAEVHVSATSRRETPAPAGRRFGDALAATSGALLGGIEAVAGFSPAHPAVSAAVRGSAGAVEAAARVGATPEGALGSTDPSDMIQSSQDSAMELLALQSEIGMEQQRFTTLSNVMKARHETAKAVIGNVR